MSKVGATNVFEVAAAAIVTSNNAMKDALKQIVTHAQKEQKRADRAEARLRELEGRVQPGHGGAASGSARQDGMSIAKKKKPQKRLSVSKTTGGTIVKDLDQLYINGKITSSTTKELHKIYAEIGMNRLPTSAMQTMVDPDKKLPKEELNKATEDKAARVVSWLHFSLRKAVNDTPRGETPTHKRYGVIPDAMAENAPTIFKRSRGNGPKASEVRADAPATAMSRHAQRSQPRPVSRREHPVDDDDDDDDDDEEEDERGNAMGIEA